MIFLIEYNQRKGEIVRSLPFQDSQRREAEDARLQTELDLNRKKIEHEVVLLEAESEDAIRQTHRRYFEGLREILESEKHSKNPDIAQQLETAEKVMREDRDVLRKLDQ